MVRPTSMSYCGQTAEGTAVCFGHKTRITKGNTRNLGLLLIVACAFAFANWIHEDD